MDCAETLERTKHDWINIPSFDNTDERPALSGQKQRRSILWECGWGEGIGEEEGEEIVK